MPAGAPDRSTVNAVAIADAALLLSFMRGNDSDTVEFRIAPRVDTGHAPATTASPTTAVPTTAVPSSGSRGTSSSSPVSLGAVLAALGVIAFSFSFPATVWALQGMGPWTAAGARGVLAAVLAMGALLLWRGPGPRRQDWPGLLVVAIGCVVGFPLLTTLALQTSGTAHSAVVIGALPMATAVISVVRTGRRPSPVFWVGAGGGGAAVTTFALAQNGGRPSLADLYLVAALLVCAAGYAEGGRLAASMPGWRVIAWGVVLAAPVNLLVLGVALGQEPVRLGVTSLVGLGYTAAVSQLLGFVLWYRGMGEIGVTRASQIQLAQPLLTVLWAALVMHEAIPPATLLTAAVVLVCVVITQRARS